MKKAYLLGIDISDSKISALYRLFLKLRGIELCYQHKEISSIGMAEVFIRKKEYMFCVVENPYKGIAFEAADVLALTVQFAHGANVVINMNSQLIAVNTEGDAVVKYLKRAGFNFHGKSVVICGTGCTALAVLHACAMNGVNSLCLVSREKSLAEKKIKTYVKTLKKHLHSEFAYIAADDDTRSLHQAFEEADFYFTDYIAAPKQIKESDLIINATRLGEKFGDLPPFNADLLSENQWVLDCVASEQKTCLVTEAMAKTKHVLDGTGLQEIVVEISLDLLEDLIDLK